MLAAMAGKHEEARRALEEGHAGARRLAAAEPGNAQFQRELAEGESRLGKLLFQRASYDGALDRFRAWQKIVAPLAEANPADLALQGELATIHGLVAGSLVMMQKPAEALVEQRKAVEIRERLVKQEPGNAAGQMEYVAALRGLAQNLLAADAANKTEALTAVQRALDHLGQRAGEKTDVRASTLRGELERLQQEILR
jgi:hypothetical protein